jgi:hypothetical protein
VANVDRRVNTDMVNAGGIVSGVGNQMISHVDQVGQAWLTQANGIIGANVAQVFVDVDSSVQRAADEFGALESKTASDVTKSPLLAQTALISMRRARELDRKSHDE